MTRIHRAGLFLALLLLPVLFSGCRPIPSFHYPPAHSDDVIDDYYGVRVPDPYRWLEDADAPETQTWIARENKLTGEFLADPPRKERIKDRLTQLWDYPRFSAPQKQASRYFFWRNTGLQNQSVLYLQNSLDGEPVEVINPNNLSPDGTVAVSNTSLSKDARLMAYGLSRSGSDWQEIKIRHVDTATDYQEVIQWCKFTSLAWTHDNKGFFYSRFPAPGTVPPEDQNNYHRVYWHQLGTAQLDDQLIYERPDDKELGFYPSITEDGKYLILNVSHGTANENRVYYRPVESSEPFIKLLDDADARYEFIGNVDSLFYFHTDLDAPRGRIIAIDTNHPARPSWREILPQQSDVINFVSLVNNQFVVVYLHDVYNILKIHSLAGAFVRQIPLPTLGTIDDLSGKPDDTEMFFAFSSFLSPGTIYRYDFHADTLAVFRRPHIDFDVSAYETKQVFYQSKDGTRIPMFIVHKKGLTLDGSHPALLYGYGGFGISLKPGFSSSVLYWLENGGVYALAHLRGGGEYGETWHKNGMLDKKQNVFDDFIAAAQWLIDNQYTSPQKLAIRGGSNGGLLVAACMNQRPDLFGAVVCQVPVTDMLRYQKFTVGRYWTPEYGNAENSLKEFKTLYAYSPLHNIKPGTCYPPILVTTADTDDRVVPSHAKKFAAALQANASRENPVLIRIETKAGHGGGKPTDKIIDETADIYAFLFKILDM